MKPSVIFVLLMWNRDKNEFLLPKNQPLNVTIFQEIVITAIKFTEFQECKVLIKMDGQETEIFS